MHYVIMLRRKVYDQLLEWKNREHKCLVISGQRQIGKTYIVNRFAENEYENSIYINFHDSPQMDSLFDGDITASMMIRKLSLQFGSDSIKEGRTLLFLDEIQDGKRAYGALKQFTLYGKIDVIASGSLLGVKNPGNTDRQGEGGSELVPMGYEETIIMHPLDFEEYLWARDFPSEEIEVLREHIRSKTPIEEAVYDRLSELYREFMIVGGMPESVARFTETQDFRASDKVLKELAASCIRDIYRYNSGIDRIRATECYESIPYQLADTNKKFMYSRINGEKSRKAANVYMDNLLWIKNAGYGDFCYGLSQPAQPLKKYIKRDMFKVYLSDTGMLLQIYGDKARMAIYKGDHSFNFGAIAENTVANNLVKNGIDLQYYRNDKGEGKMELDFVTEFWDGLTVIEVKSGNDRAARSLMKVDNYFRTARRIMFEDGNIHTDGEGIEHYPLFASAFIREMDQQTEGPRFS